jgi:hypothetical protein
VSTRVVPQRFVFVVFWTKLSKGIVSYLMLLIFAEMDPKSMARKIKAALDAQKAEGKRPARMVNEKLPPIPRVGGRKRSREDQENTAEPLHTEGAQDDVVVEVPPVDLAFVNTSPPTVDATVSARTEPAPSSSANIPHSSMLPPVGGSRERRVPEASWLTEGFVVPGDEAGLVSLAEEIGNVPRIANLGRLASTPRFVGNALLSRVVNCDALPSLVRAPTPFVDRVSAAGVLLSEVRIKLALFPFPCFQIF